MSSASADPPPLLLPTMEAEVAALKKFVVLLERERQLLATGETDGLHNLVSEKNGLAVQLTTLGARRGEFLVASGLSADHAGIHAWLDAHPAADRARSTWRLLLSLATQARELNTANGDLIQIRMQQNALALDALLGATASLRLYGPDGQSAPLGGRRISDCA